MSKQSYWSSGARRKDWSVNSLRCWRCLVINTPDETPSKAHPLFTGSLLRSLCIRLPSVFCFWLLMPECTVYTWFELGLIFRSAYYCSLAVCPLFDCFFTYWNLSANNLFPSFLPVLMFLPSLAVCFFLCVLQAFQFTTGKYTSSIKILERANKLI